MPRPNLTSLIKDEIVKRFEDVVKEEVKSHNIAVEKSNRDILELKKIFEEHRSILLKTQAVNHADLMEIKNDFEKAKNEIVGIQNVNLQALGKKEKDISESLSSFCHTLLTCAKNEDLLDLEKNFQAKMTNLDQKIEKERICQENIVFENYSKIRHELQTDLEKNNQLIKKLNYDLEKFKKDLDINIVDAAGIRRSLKVDEKTMFVIEKKLEHIYSEMKKIKEKVFP